MSVVMPDDKQSEVVPSVTETTKPEAVEAAPPAKEVPKPDGKVSTVEIVKAKREEQRLSRAKDTAAAKETPGPTTKEPEKAHSDTTDDGADEKADLQAKDDKEKSGKSTFEDQFGFTEAELNKPGFFDRITPEQRAKLEEKAPWALKLVNAGRAEAQRHVENAKLKIAKAPPAEKQPTTVAAETDSDMSEAIDLLYDPKTRKDGLAKLLTNPDSKSLLKDVVMEVMGSEFGYDPSLKPLNEGIALASKDYPQLADDETFFAEVTELLQEDPEAFEDLVSEKKPRLIAVVLKEASARVVRSRAAKKPAEKPAAAPATEDKRLIGTKERRETLERNTQAARDQASLKAAGASRPSVAEAEASSTVELVRRTREAKGYQFVGK